MNKNAFNLESIILILSKFINYFAIFIAGILIVRYLSKTDYGTYSQIQLLVGTVSFIFNLGISKSLYYFIPISENKIELILQNIIFLLIIGVLGAGLILIFANQIALFMNNQELISFRYITFLLLIITTLGHLSNAIFINFDKVKVLNILNILTAILQLLVIMLLIYFKANIFHFLLGNAFLSSTNLIFILIFISSKKIDYSKIINIQILYKQIKYSIPIALSSITLIFLAEIDKYIISYYFSLEQFAIYSRGATRIPIPIIVTATISYYMLPTLVKQFNNKKIDDFLRTLHDTIVKTAILVILVASIFFIIAKDFVIFLYTETYINSVPVFIIYTLLLPLQIAGYDSVFQSVGKTKYILKASLVSLCLNVLLSIFLVNVLGFLGPPIATVISKFFEVLYYQISLKYVLKVSIKKVFPWKKIMLIFILSFSLIFVSKMIMQNLHMTLYLNLVIIPLFFSFFYISGLILLGIIDRKKLLLRWQRNKIKINLIRNIK